MSARVITLLSDFGLRDGYVGAMKGVLLSHCPAARLVDISHDIAPGGIDAASYVLLQAAPHFPEGTVHLVVVDPGVGSERRAVTCRIGAHLYVAPDNGVLSLVIAEGELTEAFELTQTEIWRDEVSDTFHGRDIFAPAAAFLARGGGLEDVGSPIARDTLVRRTRPVPSPVGETMHGCVVYVDRFGNLVTNLPLEAGRAAEQSVEVEGRRIPLRRTYSDVPTGSLVALRGSLGLLEIARNGGSAAAALGVAAGALVIWRARDRS